MPLAPVIALSHGGGPLPLLGDPDHEAITASLRQRVPRVLGLGTPRQPRAIVVVTAHWASDGAAPAVSVGAAPELLYDYHNFPAEAYRLRYGAAGAPDVAAALAAALAAEDAALAPRPDARRGWDHGVFVRMMLASPRGAVPLVQLSVLRSEDAAAHLRVGRALARLREEGVAVVGSGFASFHNFGEMRALAAPGPARDALAADVAAWNAALAAAVEEPARGPREAALAAWRGMPHADRMHPPGGGEHLMPLLVCAGAAAEGEAARHYADRYKGLDMYTFYWGAAEEVD